MIIDNRFLVGLKLGTKTAGAEREVYSDEDLVSINQCPHGLLTREEALNLAAWLAAVADRQALLPEGEFQKTLQAVTRL